MNYKDRISDGRRSTVYQATSYLFRLFVAMLLPLDSQHSLSSYVLSFELHCCSYGYLWIISTSYQVTKFSLSRLFIDIDISGFSA